jgi:hypothetical protein
MGVISRRERLPVGQASSGWLGWLRSAVSFPESWRWASLAWISTRAGLLTWSLVLEKLGLIRLGAGAQYTFGLAQPSFGPGTSFISNWLRWDAIHYVRIAAFGYVSPDLSAFHPLYPLLGRLVAPLMGGSELLALLLVSNVAALLAFVLFYELVDEILGPQVARSALMALVLFPSAFFLFAPYGESLTLFLTLLAYREARRSRWLAALTVGVAAGLTHPMALPLSALLAWETGRRWAQAHAAPPAPILLLPLAPVLGSGLFLGWQKIQELPSWPTIHHEGWGVVTQWPWETLAEIPGIFGSAFFPVTGWINLAALALAMIMVIWGASHLPRPFVAFQVAIVVLLLSFDVAGEPLSSWMRHAMMMFPLFVGLGMLCNTPARRLSYAAIALGLQLYFAALFLQWIWVG